MVGCLRWWLCAWRRGRRAVWALCGGRMLAGLSGCCVRCAAARLSTVTKTSIWQSGCRILPLVSVLSLDITRYAFLLCSHLPHSLILFCTCTQGTDLPVSVTARWCRAEPLRLSACALAVFSAGAFPCDAFLLHLIPYWITTRRRGCATAGWGITVQHYHSFSSLLRPAGHTGPTMRYLPSAGSLCLCCWCLLLCHDVRVCVAWYAR